MIQYFLKRRARKRGLTLRVNVDGTAVVSASRKAPLSWIKSFVLRHAPWVKRKQEEMRRLRESFPALQFVPGEKYLLWGRRIVFEEITSLAGGLDAAILKEFYAQATARKAQETADRFGPILGLKPTGISTVEQKVIWGSCSSTGDIRLNWRLSMAPPEILEYVMVHELCHIRYMNHSRKFWNLLGSVIPDYKARRAWLKANGPGLVWMFP